MILAVETSGRDASIAISEGVTVLAERVLTAEKQRHAQSLVAEVQTLLNRQQLRVCDIQTVAVSIGPGSFTGLRVGLVFAKTFAWLNGCRLVAVDTLHVIARQALPSLSHADTKWNSEEQIPVVTAIMDAQRGEVFAASYKARETEQSAGCRLLMERLSPVSVCSPESLSVHHLITGPGLEKMSPEQRSMFRISNSAAWTPRASAVALIGAEMSEEGLLADPATLEPVYVRASYAEEKRDSLREASREGSA